MNTTQKLLKNVAEFSTKSRLIPPYSSVLIALSGGVDSVALTLLLSELKKELKIKRIACAHYNHNLRGDESEGDEEFCSSLCKKLSIDFYSDRLILENKKIKASKQEFYREKRYAFLKKAAKDNNYQLIATAHTLEDVVENVVMRLFSGSGPKGLSGIKEKNENIIRPLINVRKEELYSFVAESSFGYRLDGSNLKSDYTRNAVRHDIIPAVERIFPAYSDAVLRFSQIIRCEDEFFEKLAFDAFKSVSSLKADELSLDIEPLINLHDALIRRVILKSADHFGVSLLYAHVKSVLSSLKSEPSGTKEVMHFEGLKIIRRYNALVFSKSKPSSLPAKEVAIEPFKECLFFDFKITSYTKELEKGGDTLDYKAGSVMAFDFDKINFPVRVKSFAEGDRIKINKGGEKKVKEMFINYKVPREVRGMCPVIADENNIIGVLLVNKDGEINKRTSIESYFGKETKKVFIIHFEKVV